MGKRYLVDTNAIIDFLNGKLPEAGRDLLADVEPVISIISKISVRVGYARQGFSTNRIFARDPTRKLTKPASKKYVITPKNYRENTLLLFDTDCTL